MEGNNCVPDALFGSKYSFSTNSFLGSVPSASSGVLLGFEHFD